MDAEERERWAEMLGGFKATGGVTTVKSHDEDASKKTHDNTLGRDAPTTKIQTID